MAVFPRKTPKILKLDKKIKIWKRVRLSRSLAKNLTTNIWPQPQSTDKKWSLPVMPMTNADQLQAYLWKQSPIIDEKIVQTKRKRNSSKILSLENQTKYIEHWNLKEKLPSGIIWLSIWLKVFYESVQIEILFSKLKDFNVTNIFRTPTCARFLRVFLKKPEDESSDGNQKEKT